MNGHPPSQPSRRSPRKPGYDYAAPGVYFVTLCTSQRKRIFGEIQDDRVNLSPLGQVADHYWRQLPSYFDHLALDEWIVMPNHVHAVVWLLHRNCTTGAELTTASRDRQNQDDFRSSTYVAPGSLSAIIGTFKSLVTRRANRMRYTLGITLWQGRYYDNIVRSEEALHRIRRYIVENPERWTLDTINAQAFEIDPAAKEIWLMLQNESHDFDT